MKVNVISIGILCLAALACLKKVSSAPVKPPTATLTHCKLDKKIRYLITRLPSIATGLSSDVYKSIQNLVSEEKKFLHQYLHKHLHNSARLWPTPQSNNFLQMQSIQTVIGLVPLKSSIHTLACFDHTIGVLITEYENVSNSVKVRASLQKVKKGIRDLLKEMQHVGKAIHPANSFPTSCVINTPAKSKKLSRKQIVQKLVSNLETLHANLLNMSVDFFELRKISYQTTAAIVHSG